MSTPEEIASLIDREHPEEVKIASKVSVLITDALKPLGLAEDPIFRSKVARELIKIRMNNRLENVS